MAKTLGAGQKKSCLGGKEIRRRSAKKKRKGIAAGDRCGACIVAILVGVVFLIGAAALLVREL